MTGNPHVRFDEGRGGRIYSGVALSPTLPVKILAGLRGDRKLPGMAAALTSCLTGLAELGEISAGVAGTKPPGQSATAALAEKHQRRWKTATAGASRSCPFNKLARISAWLPACMA